MTQVDWPAEVSRVIASQVRATRKLRGMSAQQLSDKCAELGHPIARSVLANLESGRRESVTVAELAILGAALDVPPALLLYDLRRQAEVQMLPGKQATPWTAYRWFIGEEPRTYRPAGRQGRRVDLDDVDFDQWQLGVEPLWTLRQHDMFALMLAFEWGQLIDNPEQSEHWRNQQLERATTAARQLSAHRATMRNNDVEPPAVADDLARFMGSVGARP